MAAASNDSAPALIALGATIELCSARGVRNVAASDFYTADGIHNTVCRPKEVVTRAALALYRPVLDWALRHRRLVLTGSLLVLVEKLGGKVRDVVISDVVDSTFYATVTLEHEGNTVEVDARPSDAIGLALRAVVGSDLDLIDTGTDADYYEALAFVGIGF